MAYEIWAGTEESYQAVADAKASLRAMADGAIKAGTFDMPDLPPLWLQDGNIAVVPVAGSLVSGSAGWLRMFGITGYDDIAQALVEAASDPEVRGIFMLYASPGGSVNGVQPVADLISKINKVKPVYAHIDPMAASAGYWLASSAGTITMDSMAQAGSIGAVIVHVSRSRALTEDGIDVTVIRSGDYKLIGGPAEPLSDLAKSEFQSKVDDLEGMFLAHVAMQRGTNATDLRENAGGGRMFLGKRAVTAGLVDKVTTRDLAMANAKKLSK